jgi:hypothetical protein
VNIEGIPNTIERTQINALVEALGIDLSAVKEISINRHTVVAHTFAKDAAGEFITVSDDGFAQRPVLHTLRIAIVDGSET